MDDALPRTRGFPRHQDQAQRGGPRRVNQRQRVIFINVRSGEVVFETSSNLSFVWPGFAFNAKYLRGAFLENSILDFFVLLLHFFFVLLLHFFFVLFL